MKTANEIKREELDHFKTQSKESALNSFSNTLSFFTFSQWLKSTYEDPKDQKRVSQEIFNQWNKQMGVSVAPVFENLNQTLNEPKVRWANLVDGICLSVEDYQDSYTAAIKEIRSQFEKVCNYNE